MRNGRAEEEGTSSAIAFSLAGVLFIAAISTVLVYANDRIPPPSKSQPHDSLAAEARAVMQEIVLSTGDAPWDNTNNAWDESNPAHLPGLVCDRGGACAGKVALDAARLDRLHDNVSATEAQGDVLDFTYALVHDRLGMGKDRDLRITVTDLLDGKVYLDLCRLDAILQACSNPTVSTRPAVAYLETNTGRDVRVTVHVFIVCNEGACLS